MNRNARIRVCRICFFAILILACMPGAAQTVAVQTDWSAGGGKPGPALSWQQTFAASQKVAWRSIPGQLALSGQTLAVPERHLIADDIDMPRFAASGDLNGDGRTDIVTVDPIYSVTEKKGVVEAASRRHLGASPHIPGFLRRGVCRHG